MHLSRSHPLMTLSAVKAQRIAVLFHEFIGSWHFHKYGSGSSVTMVETSMRCVDDDMNEVENGRKKKLKSEKGKSEYRSAHVQRFRGQ